MKKGGKGDPERKASETDRYASILRERIMGNSFQKKEFKVKKERGDITVEL